MGSNDSYPELFSGIAAVGAAGGILTFALFPFAVPMLLLTLAAVLPLALPVIALAVVGAILAGVWLGVRAAGRGIRRLSHRSTHPGATRAQAV
jgi:hypothetical protein